jgi:O-antigen ligase
VALPLGIAPAQVALAAGLLLYAATLVRHRGPWTPSPLDLPILGLLLVAGLSAGLSSRPVSASAAALSLWTVLPFLLAREAAADVATVRRLLRCLLAGALLAATMGIAEGFAPELLGRAGVFDRLGIPDPRFLEGRASGFFSHPMTFAGQQAILLVTFTALAAWGAGPPRGAAGWVRRLAPLPSLAVALVLTGARAPTAAATAGLAILLAAAWRSRGSRLAAATGLASIGLGTVGAGAVLVRRFVLLAGVSPGVSRAEMWHACLAMLREHPLLGIGPGGYRREVVRWVDTAIFHPAHAHSTPLHLAAELGLAGLAAWITLWAAFYAALTPRAWRMLRRRDPRSGVPAAAWLAAGVFLLAGLFEHNLGDAEVAMLAFFLAGLPFGRAFHGRTEV